MSITRQNPVRSSRGEWAAAKYSQTWISCHVGNKCDMSLLKLKTARMAYSCSKSLEIIFTVDPHLVEQSAINMCQGSFFSIWTYLNLVLFLASRKVTDNVCYPKCFRYSVIIFNELVTAKLRLWPKHNNLCNPKTFAALIGSTVSSNGHLPFLW